MKQYIHTINNFASTKLLFLFTIFCLNLSATRVFISKDKFFLFLVWNLFLAIIPWFIASILYVYSNLNKFLVFLLLSLWLLFFPNSLYILTDIVHIKIAAPKYIWLDLILLLSYSFCGVYYGFVSLLFIEFSLNKIYLFKHTYIFSITILYLASFGIYLGRFLRWNSWDLFTNLKLVINDILDRMVDPFAHSDVWLFTFALGTLLNIIYFSYRFFKTPCLLERNYE